MAFQGVDVGRPETSELLDPVVEFLEWFGPQAVQATLGVHGGFDKTSVAQDAKMLGDTRLGDTEVALELSDRLLRRAEKGEDGAAIGLCDDLKDGGHVSYIRLFAYTCQGI